MRIAAGSLGMSKITAAFAPHRALQRACKLVSGNAPRVSRSACAGPAPPFPSTPARGGLAAPEGLDQLGRADPV